MMAEGERLALVPQGLPMTKQEILLHGLGILGRWKGFIYYPLALTLPDLGASIQVGGVMMTQEALLLESIRELAGFALACYVLAHRLPDQRTVKLHDGRKMSKQQLYCEALARNFPCPALVHHDLGRSLPVGGRIQVPPDNRIMTREELLTSRAYNI